MTLEIQHDRSLVGLNTLGLPAMAEHYVHVRSEAEVCEALTLAKSRSWPVTVLGGGSNLVLRGNLPGLVLHVGIPGILFEGTVVEAGAGEPWHPLVLSSLEQGLSGLENLSLIPGSVGAAPIQNIGAYGAELTDVFESLTAIARDTLDTLELSRDDCRFGYRDSIFKHALRDRVIITRVRIRLDDTFEANLEYEPLRAMLTGPGQELTARRVSDAVITMRRSKLPDPGEMGNVGSFFKNPLVDSTTADRLRRLAPGLPCWQTEGGMKVSAAWLIEQCGLKGQRRGRAGVSPRHALVVVNLGGATGEDVMALAGMIQTAVEGRFGIRLDLEPVVY